MSLSSPHFLQKNLIKTLLKELTNMDSVLFIECEKLEKFYESSNTPYYYLDHDNITVRVESINEINELLNRRNVSMNELSELKLKVNRLHELYMHLRLNNTKYQGKRVSKFIFNEHIRHLIKIIDREHSSNIKFLKYMEPSLKSNTDIFIKVCLFYQDLLIKLCDNITDLRVKEIIMSQPVNKDLTLDFQSTINDCLNDLKNSFPCVLNTIY